MMRGWAPGRRWDGTGKMTEEEAYQVLGIQPGASTKEISRAHRSLIKNCIPTKAERRISRPASMRPRTCYFAVIVEIVHHSKNRTFDFRWVNRDTFTAVTADLVFTISLKRSTQNL